MVRRAVVAFAAMPDPAATDRGASRALLIAAGFAVLFLAVAWWFLSLGAASSEALGKLLFVVQSILLAGGIAALWLASAMGWGRLARPILRDSDHPFLLQLGVGMATLLWLEHALGYAGLLATRLGAWALAGAGVVLLVHQLRKLEGRGRAPRVHPVGLLLAPSAAILLVAASSMPGWLWDSEKFGFDVLEYHLQCPAEWLEVGRLTSLQHNVYSYLPGYLEAAYMHLAAAFGSMYAARGLVLLAAQFLHAALTLTVAVSAGLFVAARLRENGAPASAGLAGTVAAAAILCVPYTVVDGSMANVEMGMIALLTLGLIACRSRGLSPAARGTIVGWLAGVAAGVKLTGVFMVGAPLALLLFLRRGERRALLPAGALGLVALLPYFLRNGLNSGNPVFPFASRIFGLGHWRPEQLARWVPWHAFTGTLGERLAMAWSQGPTHPLWSILLPLSVVAAILAWRDRAIRPLAVAAALVLVVQLLAWMFFTHLFARFLLPILPVAGILIGIAAGSAHARAATAGARALAVLVCAAAILPLSMASLRAVAEQRGGNPAQFIGSQAFDVRTGGYFAEHQEQVLDAPIEYVTNFVLPPDSKVYVIGESRVLYLMRPKVYNTPWDKSVLGELIRLHPDQPAQWARGLAALGITHVRLSVAELDRIQRLDRIGDPLVSLALVQRFLATYGRLVARKPGISEVYALGTEAPAP